jgi:hypothetical protein
VNIGGSGRERGHKGPPARVTSLTVKGTTLASIKTNLARAAAVGTLGMTAAAGFVAPASAATAGWHATTAGPRVATTGPNTDIAGSPAVWKPNKLTVKSVSSAKCSTSNYSFSVTNTTKVSQAVQEKTSTGKKTVFTLKPKAKEAVCVSGPAGASGKLFIKSSGKALTITIG